MGSDYVQSTPSTTPSGDKSGIPASSVSEVTGQHSEATASPAVVVRPVAGAAEATSSGATDHVVMGAAAGEAAGGGPASDGLLPLEPPLSSSDYSFSLDDQENLNDLFDLF